MADVLNALPLPSSDALALIDARTDERLSFRELIERGQRIAESIGGERSLMFVLARNDPFSAGAYVGALQSRHVVALVDPQTPMPQLAELVDAYRPAAVLGPSGLGHELASQGTAVAEVLKEPGGELVRMPAGKPPTLAPDLALMLSTSGTTGSRKFVRLSARNVASNASAIRDYLGLTPADRPITSLPMYYTFGLSVLNSHWLAGAAVVMTDAGVLDAGFWSGFREQACTSLAGVPFTYRVLERIGFRSMDLPSLETMQQAGGALDRQLTETYARHMTARGGRFYVMYGQTEATARISYVPPGRLPDKLGSAGVAIPGGEIRIEPSGERTADGHEIGEVVYRGPNVMLGYAESANDLARGDDMGGVLATGDLGYLDDEGFLFLVGRSKRIAKVFGHRLSLDEVEALLATEGPAAVVEGNDALWVFCEFGDDGQLERIRADLARRLRLRRAQVQLRRVDAVPLAATGKVDYQLLREWVAVMSRAPVPAPA